MLRCKPNQPCMIMNSINDNRGKVVRTVENVGWVVFRRPDGEGGFYPLRKANVWTVKTESQLLTSNPATAKILCERYGPEVVGLYADSDLMPLGDPDLENTIIDEAFAELDKALGNFGRKK